MTPTPPSRHLDLRLLDERLAVCRLPPEAALPAWLERQPLWAAVRRGGELSLVVPEAHANRAWPQEPGWRALEVAGPLDLSEVGILATLSGLLAAAEVPLFALSTFDTDLLLVREAHLERAVAALLEGGHQVRR